MQHLTSSSKPRRPARRWQLLRGFPGLAVLGCLLMAGVSCTETPEAEAPKSQVLARVGDQDITVTDFDIERDRRLESGRPVTDSKSLLDDMVLREALLQRARQRGIDHDPAVRRELENILIGKLRDTELLSRLDAIEVTDEEVAAEYERRISEYTRPAKVRLAMLFKEIQPGMSDTRRSELKQLMAEAKTKALTQPAKGGRGPAAMGFGAVSIDFSDDQISRYRGGDIGWLEPGRFDYRWPREVLAAGYELEQGRISDLIETDGGMYLVMKTDQRSSQMTPLETVRQSLKQAIVASQRKKLDQDFRDESITSAGVVVNEDVLARVRRPLNEAHAPERKQASLSLPPAVGTTTDEN